MPFPRRPKGEKPATTILLLRKNIAMLISATEKLREENRIQSNTIAGLNAYKDDLEQEANDIKEVLDHERQTFREAARRLNFLEGYYAAHQEALPPKDRNIARNQSETDHRTGPRDQENIRDGEETNKKYRTTTPREARYSARPREEVRSERQYDRQDPQWEPLENFEIGLARDANPRRDQGSDSYTITFP